MNEEYPIKQGILCVQSLIDFHLMAQYQNYIHQALEYRDQYLTEFRKDIYVFLQFSVLLKKSDTKTRAAVKLLKEIQDVQTPHIESRKKRNWKENILKRKELLMKIKLKESHFNFPKLYQLSHFR